MHSLSPNLLFCSNTCAILNYRNKLLYLQNRIFINFAGRGFLFLCFFCLFHTSVFVDGTTIKLLSQIFAMLHTEVPRSRCAIPCHTWRTWSMQSVKTLMLDSYKFHGLPCRIDNLECIWSAVFFQDHFWRYDTENRSLLYIVLEWSLLGETSQTNYFMHWAET